MIQHSPTSIDNLVNNLPDVLKASRQFVAWNPGRGEKKVPLKAGGSRGGNYNDPKCWRTFDDAIDLLERGRAFGVGLVLPSQQTADAFPGFNLITGLIAVDADAKRCATAIPYNVPENIDGYVQSLQSYSEFSSSLKGLRALAYGNIPTDKQNITKHFHDGTELGLYRAGWVTLTGLVCVGSPPTIEHRQEAIDYLVKELWSDLKVGKPIPTKMLVSAYAQSASFEETFVCDWSRTISHERIRQFIRGLNRTAKQLRDISDTWDLKRGWNHGNTPDSSMYTKRIVEEALWLRPFFGWALQDVVDIVITFCKKNNLRWSFGRAKKQIADGQLNILGATSRLDLYLNGADVATFAPLLEENTPTLTCIGPQISGEQNVGAKLVSTNCGINPLPIGIEVKSRDTSATVSGGVDEPKVSRRFKHKSTARDAVIEAVRNRTGWIKPVTIAVEISKSVEAVKKQLQRLERLCLVDGDGKGRYRKHLERPRRKPKPCSSKPIPRCRITNSERKMLSRTELSRRGWPSALIEQMFPEPGKDYVEKEIALGERSVKGRFYWVSRIKALELQPWFEIERAKIRTEEKTES